MRRLTGTKGLSPEKHIVHIGRKSLVLTIERLVSTAQAFYSYKGDRILSMTRTLSQKVDYGIPTSDARSRETLINYLNSKTLTRGHHSVANVTRACRVLYYRAL